MAAKNQINTDEIQKAVEEAERIVSTVKDNQLKLVAFKEVLSVLISGMGSISKKGRKRTTAKTKEGSQGNKETRKTPRAEGPTTLVKELIDEGFFGEPKNINDVVKKLSERGHSSFKPNDISGTLQNYAKTKDLDRKKQVIKEGEKPKYYYTNHQG